MAAHSPRGSGGPVLRSTSPPRRINCHYSASTPSFPSSSSFATATSSAFSTARSLRRPTSPARVNPSKHTSPSLSFPVDRPGSLNQSISVSTRGRKSPSAAGPKRTCMCSPTNHPGSFRCSSHKTGSPTNRVSGNPQTVLSSCGSSSRLNMRRSAMKNSLVRISTVEGDLMKRALAALIRPSSHRQRRRREFLPCPSRLCVVSTA